MTDEQHNKYIAYAFLGFAGFQLLMTLFIAAIWSVVFLNPGGPRVPSGIIALMIGFLVVFQSLFTAPSVVAAYALLKRKPWARIASIVAGIFSAMNVPFGTAACVYALWFFFSENWKTVYEAKRDPNLIARGEETKFEGTYSKESERFSAYQPPDWR